ncbi:formate dehydrogenase subunit gamma [soil metagenome]
MSAQIHTSTRQDTVRSIAQDQARERGPLLLVLHAVQADLGYIDNADVSVIADVLNLSIAEVHGVISFYKDFRTSPPPAHTVAVCRAEACQAVGASALFDQAQRAFAGREDVEVEEIFCFGNCALGPTAMIDGALYGRVTEQRVSDLTGDWA